MFIICRPSQLIFIPIRKKIQCIRKPFSYNNTWCQHYVTFVYPLRLVILQRFERNTYSGSRYIRLFNFWSWVQIIHLPPKRTFFEILLMRLLSIYHALLCCKVSKNSLKHTLRYSFHIFFAKLGQKLTLCPRRGFFGKFHLRDFCLPFILY